MIFPLRKPVPSSSRTHTLLYDSVSLSLSLRLFVYTTQCLSLPATLSLSLSSTPSLFESVYLYYDSISLSLSDSVSLFDSISLRICSLYYDSICNEHRIPLPLLIPPTTTLPPLCRWVGSPLVSDRKERIQLHETGTFASSLSSWLPSRTLATSFRRFVST